MKARMTLKKEIQVVRDFMACLVKCEAMRAANDARRYLNLPPMYETAQFENLMKYIQLVENSIVEGKKISFVKKAKNAPSDDEGLLARVRKLISKPKQSAAGDIPTPVPKSGKEQEN